MNCIIILIIVFNLIVSVELKENVDSVSHLKEKIFLDVEKRLNKWSNNEMLSGYGCHTLNLNSTIIMAHASLANGASYIPARTVSSAQQCASACCDVQDCNVAVYKLKGNSNLCYLFNCGTDTKLCNFTRLEGYVSMKLDDHSRDSKSDIEEASDIENQLPHVADSKFINNATTRLPFLDTTTMSSSTDKYGRVSLFGSCEANSDCSTVAAECVVSFCLCREGYHAQEGHCRRDCTRFEFECVNEGHPLADPQCIAVYDACDGVAHCADESDERSCPASNAELSSSVHAKESSVEGKNDGSKAVLSDQSVHASNGDHSYSDQNFSNGLHEFAKQDHHSEPFTDTKHNNFVQTENSIAANTENHSDESKYRSRYNEDKQVQGHVGENKIQQSGHSEGHALMQNQLMDNENQRDLDNSYVKEQSLLHSRHNVGRGKGWPQWDRHMNDDEDLSEKHASQNYVDYYQPGYDIERNDAVPHRRPYHNHLSVSSNDNPNYESHQQLSAQATDYQMSAHLAKNNNKKIITENEEMRKSEKTMIKSHSHVKEEQNTTIAVTKLTTSSLVVQSSSSTSGESVTVHQSSKTEMQETSLFKVTEIDEGVRSAMIILIMGLLLTFITLVLIGCRLRTMKMRLRRGATLNSQEADYLINGMYL